MKEQLTKYVEWLKQINSDISKQLTEDNSFLSDYNRLYQLNKFNIQ